MKLLVVDDEKIIREGLLALKWESIGISEVKSAENGIDAINIISDYKPDILLTDIELPGFTGLDIAEKIKGFIKKDIKIIILSGYGTFEYAKRAMKNGVFEYLLKPSSPKEILQTVHKAVLDLNKEDNFNKEKMANEIAEKVFEEYDDNYIKDILKYIEDNYMNNISLTSLSNFIHLTPTYLSKIIKKETGYNFVMILTTTRMLKAAELITNTNDKIINICEQVGIKDQRYFSQIFNKTFGYKPLEYRKYNKGRNVKMSLKDYFNPNKNI